MTPWLHWRRLRFRLTPARRRVAVALRNDGRYIPFLLTAIHDAGFAVQVLAGDMVFRELQSLKSALALPFEFGGPARKCRLQLSDTESNSRRGDSVIRLDYDFFDLSRNIARGPYYMHPSVYHQGRHRSPDQCEVDERPVRLAFYGTGDREFYSRSFSFDAMNRTEVLDVFLSQVGQRAWRALGSVRDWQKREIAISLDRRGGDLGTKEYMPLPEYLEALGRSDFVLSPPGWCMPLSHSVIEAMSRGAIPILNGNEWIEPRLTDGVNCLAFKTPDEVGRAIQRALNASVQEVRRMRAEVVEYYRRHLEPGAWFARVAADSPPTILVNNEEHSVERRYPGFQARPTQTA
jgi:hypothetical protein